ncbi:O-antigen ligase family protein [Uliginosibacterium paludis]|uniref:O-antigen ligase family protein n=1 Tax=Uliginosibacterium paludis TaxID=1615952 RepID=A0ABV2CMP3_9RHOO
MPASERRLDRFEFILLCLFAIALPLVEAPKNIFWALFLLLWLGNSLRRRDFGTLALPWDCLFAGLFLVPLASLLNTAYTPQWKELGDIAGYVSLGWILARSRLDARQVRLLIYCLIGATLAGVLHGYWVLATEPKRIWLQLNSVGHVNHSALYGAGIAILAAALAAVSGRLHQHRECRIGLVAALLMLGVMIGFASRGALVAYLLGVLPCVLLLGGMRLRTFAAVCVAAVVFGAGTQWLTSELTGSKNNQTLLQKTVEGVEQGHLSSFRLQAFHTATEMARQFPLTGVGPANFRAVSPEMLEGWVRARGEPFERQDYFFADHAHGIYANTLAERGLLGIGILAVLGVSWLAALIRRLPGDQGSELARLAWGAGLAGFTVVFVGGLFNTTLHHEHGMLAMICLGLLLSGAPQRSRSAA